MVSGYRDAVLLGGASGAPVARHENVSVVREIGRVKENRALLPTVL